MRRALTLVPDRRLDKLFNDVLGLDAAWLRGVPSNRLAAVARSEKMPPSVFRWELDRLRRFGGDGPMPRGCHLDGSDVAGPSGAVPGAVRRAVARGARMVGGLAVRVGRLHSARFVELMH